MKLRYLPAPMLALFTAVGFVIYFPALKAPFIFDDQELILNNPLARNIGTLFSQWKIAGLKFLTYLTFTFNFTVGGPNPFGYHLVNVALHIVNAWLLYVLAHQILKAPQIFPHFKEKQKLYIPLASALLFLVHPVATSAVSYVWQRAELLTTTFYLATLIFFVIGRLEKRNFYFLLVGFLFLCGMLAKGTMISLPLVLILVECALWPLSKRKVAKILLPTVIVIFLSVLLLWEPWQARTDDYTLPFINLTGTFLTWEYVWTELFVMVKYLGLAFFPYPQNFDYDLPLAESFFEPRIYLSFIILVALIACAIKCWKKYRMFALGIFWFLLCLLPAALLSGREPMWEYRMYLPLAGLSIGMVATIFQWFELRKAKSRLIVVILIFAALAFSRNLLWQSPEFLLLDNIQKSPNKPNPYQLLGAFYLNQGRIDDAQTYLEKTIALAPDAAESYNNLGLIAKNRGQLQKAEELFETAIRYRPTLSGAYVNLAYMVLNRGDDKKAEQIVHQGLEFAETEGLDACLGKIYLLRGRLDESETFLNKSLVINPQASPAYFWYGQLYVARQQSEKARAMFKKAVDLNPRLTPLVPSEFR